MKYLHKRISPDVFLRFRPKEGSSHVEKFISKEYMEFADRVMVLITDSRYRAIFLERLEESYMWSIKSNPSEEDEISED